MSATSQPYKETEQEIASSAISLQDQINKFTVQLDVRKEELRKLANDHKKESVVEGAGKVNISAPSAGSETKILIFDEERLNKSPELRQKLIEKGVAKESVKKVSASAAKVTIKPNV